LRGHRHVLLLNLLDVAVDQSGVVHAHVANRLVHAIVIVVVVGGALVHGLAEERRGWRGDLDVDPW